MMKYLNGRFALLLNKDPKLKAYGGEDVHAQAFLTSKTDKDE
jgi:hypothetical protein